MNDTDEEIDTAEIEEEEWIEYMKRFTAIAVETMKAAKIPCGIETHRRMKRLLAMRIASLPDEWWAKKAAEWNPASASDTRHADQFLFQLIVRGVPPFRRRSSRIPISV